MTNPCPLCDIIQLQDWETVCSRCWKLIGRYDKFHGTDFQDRIRKYGSIVIGNITVIQQTCYFPLTPEERRKRVRKIVDSQCIDCKRKMQAGSKDPCWECPWQWLMNEIAGCEE